MKRARRTDRPPPRRGRGPVVGGVIVGVRVAPGRGARLSGVRRSAGGRRRRPPLRGRSAVLAGRGRPPSRRAPRGRRGRSPVVPGHGLQDADPEPARHHLPQRPGLSGRAGARGDPATLGCDPGLTSPPVLGDTILRTEGGAIGSEVGAFSPKVSGRGGGVPTKGAGGRAVGPARRGPGGPTAPDHQQAELFLSEAVAPPAPREPGRRFDVDVVHALLVVPRRLPPGLKQLGARAHPEDVLPPGRGGIEVGREDGGGHDLGHGGRRPRVESRPGANPDRQEPRRVRVGDQPESGPRTTAREGTEGSERPGGGPGATCRRWGGARGARPTSAVGPTRCTGCERHTKR